MNDVKAGTVTADVTAAPAPVEGASTMAADATSLVAVAAGPAGAQGTYKATALAPSAIGASPHPPAGSTGTIRCASVPTAGRPGPDGRTGLLLAVGRRPHRGHEQPGLLDRRGLRLRARATSSGATSRAPTTAHDTASGDQCWAYDNATLMLNGTSGELVKDDTTGEWHLRTTTAPKVEQLTGATNGDNDGEYWKVTTTDGTQYFFGLNRLPGWASGQRGDQLHLDRAGLRQRHRRALLQRHVRQRLLPAGLALEPRLRRGPARQRDVLLLRQRETNHYARNGKTDVNGTTYDRGGYLKRIDYGQRDGAGLRDQGPGPGRLRHRRALPARPPTSTARRSNAPRPTRHWPDVPGRPELRGRPPSARRASRRRS